VNNCVNSSFEFVKQLGQELASNDFDLPPFPDTALRVQDALRDPDVDINRLGLIIMSEPTLAARLLRMANSVMMRRSGTMEITDINTAISRIGLTMVQNAAVSFAAREAFTTAAGSAMQERLERLRRHSVKVAAFAYMLGRKADYIGKADEAMLAGLLHSVGKFYILTRAESFPELFADEAALDELIAQWHSGVGRAIVESWGFPESIALAVDEHELLERGDMDAADVTDLVLVANLLATFPDEEHGRWEELHGLPSLARMNLEGESLQALVESSREDVASMVSAMTG